MQLTFSQVRSVQAKALLASYHVSHRTVKYKKPHIICEDVVPAAAIYFIVPILFVESMVITGNHSTFKWYWAAAKGYLWGFESATHRKFPTKRIYSSSNRY